MKKFLMLVLMLVFVLGTLMSVSASEFTIKYAHGDPPDAYKGSAHADSLAFKNYVESRSGGRISVEIYPACQLGSERELFEGVKMGSIEMCNVGGGFEGFYPPVMVWSIPYVFISPPVAWEVLDGEFGDAIKEGMLEATGVRLLELTENGFRNFTNNKRPIRTPKDLEGLKFRTVESPVHMKMVESLGGNPVPIAWGELYTALQQKVVDGQENPVSLIETAKFYEVQKYLTLDGHLYSVDITVINEDFFQKLPDDLKNVVKDGAKIGSIIHRGFQQFNSETGAERLRELGMEIYAPTTEELAMFQEKSQQPVIEYLKEQIDPKWIDLLFVSIEKAEKKLYPAE